MKSIAVALGADRRRDFFWLDSGFGMTGSSPLRGLGFNLRFGGIFTSVPAVVTSAERADPVILGDIATATVAGDPQPPASRASAAVADAAAVAATGDPVPSITAAGRGPFNPGDVTGGLSTMTHRLDLFGLGLDYAMYHKTFLGEFDRDELSGWQNLGGVFTSAPSAIVAAPGRIDVFGLGMDHALYTKRFVKQHIIGHWTPDWERLGGTFTSAASLVSRSPGSIDLFVRGADFTLRGNRTDGTSWFGFQNHGGILASAPAAVSWGPERIDVFAVFRDGALWHIWWDGQIWNEWESLGGDYSGEPAAVSWAPGRLDVFVTGAKDGRLHHHWFSNNSWSFPDMPPTGTNSAMAGSPTAVSAAPERLEVFVPCEDRQIRIVTWDGQAWSAMAAGAQARIPSRYIISVDLVKAARARALNADTDAAGLTVAAGNALPVIRTQWIGDIGGTHPKTSQTNLLDIGPVTVDLAEPMSFNYIVVNNGHAEQGKILAALATAGDSLSLAGSSSMQEDIGKGIATFVSVKIAEALSVSVPVLGSALGAIESWLMGKLIDAAFKPCDGLVAVELRAMMGRDLFILTDNGRNTVQITTKHAGTDSPTACGRNSAYEVTWRIRPV
jgi:hypothetical protein